MPNSIQVIGSVNVSGTVHPVDKVFTLLSGISTVAGSSSSSSYKSVRWYVSGIEGITEPYDGMKIAIKVPLAGVATAGAVFSINGDLDANYHPLAYNVNTVLTTHFPVNSIKIFTYDASQTMDCYLASKTKVTITGVWKAESNYDSNSNTIGYQVRTHNAVYKNGASTTCYRYQILVETENGLEAFTSTNNQTGTTKTQLSPKYIPNGTIRYYSTTTNIASGSNFGTTALWQQYQGINLKYSFNIATITTNSPCYIKMSRNTDGTLSPVYSATSGGHPLVFELPSTKDGYYYTYLGRTYTSSDVVYLELELDHPTFYYDGGINIYNCKESEYALEINLNEFNNQQRDFTDAEIAALKNSNKPIKLNGVTEVIDVESVSGFALLHKNINDMGIDAIGPSAFDSLLYSTVIVVGFVLAKYGIQIDCNTKVGTIAYCKVLTNIQFNNDLNSILDSRQYYVSNELGSSGQIVISTGDINNPFTYGDKSIKYLHFNQGTTPPASASFSGTQGTTSKNSGSAVNVASSTHTHTVTATGNVTLSGTRTTSGTGTAARRTLTITASFSGTSASTGAPSGTTPVAPNEHTHTITPGGSITFTAGTAPSLTSNTTSTNGIKYNEDIS